MKKWKVLERGDGYVREKVQVEMYHVTINTIGVSGHSVKLRRCGITDVGHSVSIRTYTLNECNISFEVMSNSYRTLEIVTYPGLGRHGAC